MAQHNWTAADLPAMSGRTAVVTGASSGLGLVTAREMAAARARVVLAVRDEAKGKQRSRDHARHDRSTVTGPEQPGFGAGLRGGLDRPLDILINNAGVMQVPQGRTADGFEVQIGTNHLGPFALTNLLLPHITDRVVIVSSEMHKRGKLRPVRQEPASNEHVR